MLAKFCVTAITFKPKSPASDGLDRHSQVSGVAAGAFLFGTGTSPAGTPASCDPFSSKGAGFFLLGLGAGLGGGSISSEPSGSPITSAGGSLFASSTVL